MSLDWNEEQIYFYYAGIALSDYPRVIWDSISPYLKVSTTLIDIGCGPGAFTLKALEEGFSVTSLDYNMNSLNMLEREIKKRNLFQKSSIIFGDWKDVKTGKFDVSVAANCFSDAIGSREGVEKIISNTNNIAVFIFPAKLQKEEFFSESLYEELNIQAPVFSKNNSFDNIMSVSSLLGKKVCLKEIEYDFGIPYEEKNDRCISFLCEKLRIDNKQVIKNHIRKHITYKNGVRWLENIRKSYLIICNIV